MREARMLQESSLKVLVAVFMRLRLSKWLLGRFVAIALLTCSGVARAELFMAPLVRAEWHVERSLLNCRLRQTVPRYGDAVFETLAGGRRSFQLRTDNNPMVEGAAELTAAAPLWNPRRKPIALGTVTIQAGKVPLRLDDDAADRVLESLRNGLVPQFMRPLQASGDPEASMAWLGLSPVNFLPAYRPYQACVAQLSPVPVEQLQIAVLEFAEIKTELSAGALRRIDQLLRYAQADRTVTGFELMSVSADTPRRLENLEIARVRLEQVTEYLRSRGIDAKQISGDYRGERPGNRRSGQRTVTIRIKRAELPLASN